MLRRTFLGTILAGLFGVKAAATGNTKPHRDVMAVTRNGHVVYVSSIENTWYKYRYHVHANTVAVIGLVDPIPSKPDLTLTRCSDILHALRYEKGAVVNLHIGKHCYKGVVRGDEPATLRVNEKDNTVTLEIPVSQRTS